MSNTFRKISAVGLTLTTAAWLSGAVMIAPVASAATADDLQAQISQLLAQINTLQSQLATAKGTSASTSATTYSRNLTVGSRGADVTALQQMLISEGYLTGSATGYFGTKTKAAVKKWQKDIGLSATGYFGPKSRAYINSSSASTGTTTGTTTGGTTTGTTTGGTTTSTTTTAPATGLKVALNSTQPSGSFVGGASRIPVLTVDLTAGTSGAVTVSDINFKKNGVIADSYISNAYLVEGNKVLAQYSSITSGVIDFATPNISLNAGQTRTITLAIDPSSSVTAGNTVSFSLLSASNITSADSSGNTITETGAFPLVGNTLTATTVSNPSLASLTITSSTVGTTVYAGTQNVLVSQWTAQSTNASSKLGSIKFKVIGSAAKSDIQNIKLFINGAQIGSTLAKVPDDGNVYFDLSTVSSSAVTITTGTSNMQVYADVMGSPNFNFAFELLNTYDIYASDVNYGVGVGVTINGGTGSTISIQNGSITVTAATDTPTGNIAKGAAGITIAKFNIYAAGEPVKVKFLDIKLTEAGSAAWSTIGNVTDDVQNIALVDNVGTAVGSSISTVASGTTNGTCTLAATTITCHFGTSASPINYIIPANTSRTISLKVDVLTGTDMTSLTGALNAMSSNLQGMTSSASASSGAASGVQLTIASNSLSAAKNSAVGTMTYAKGQGSAKIGSYTLSASSAEGVSVANLTVTMSASSTDFQNLMVKVGGTQFGTTKAVMSGSDVVTFAGSSPIAVPVGGSVVLDVYADVLSSASQQTNSALTTLTSCVGTGASTFTSVSCSPTSVGGQSVTIAGAPTYTVSLSSASAPTKQIVMSSTANSLATFRFTDTANVEAMKISTLVVSASSTNSATTPAFQNVKLYNGTALVGGPISAVASGTSMWTYTFNFATPPQIPQNGSLELAVVGDVASYTSGGATSNKNYIFKVNGTGDITAIGAGSNSSATATLNSPTGNTLTVLRSKLTLSSAVIGATSSRTRSAADDIANLTFNADPGYDVTVNTITLKFQGVAVSNGIGGFAVDLIDPNTGSDWSGLSAGTCTPGAGNSCSVSFTLSTIPTISMGTGKTVKIRANSTGFIANSSSNPNPSLSISVNSASDVNWGDGVTTNGLSLESTVIPYIAANVSY